MVETAHEVTDFSAFLPLIYAAAPGVPETAAETYLRESAIAFCERSGWLEREACLNLVCGVRDYPLVPDPLERIVRVMRAHADHCELRPVRDADRHRHGWGGYWVEAMSTPDASVWLTDCPVNFCKLRVRYQVAPAEDACQVDARLAEEWRRAIVDGALAELCLLPNQQFSSASLATFYAKRFDAAASRARIRRWTGRNGSSDRWDENDVLQSEGLA